MQRTKKKKHIIFVAKGDRPSRFQLDLKEIMASKNFTNHHHNHRDLGGVEKVASSTDDKSESGYSQKEELKNEFYNKAGKWEEKLSYFTIFPLILLVYKIGKAVLKTIYHLVLGIFFILKFILFVPLKILSWLNIFAWFKERPEEAEQYYDNKVYTVFNNKFPEEKFRTNVRNKIEKVDWKKSFAIFTVIYGLLSKIKIKRPGFLEKLGLKPKLESKFHFHIKLPRFKNQTLNAAFYLGVVMLFLILPFKSLNYYFSLSDLRARVMGISQAAVENIKTGAEQASDKNFTDAKDNFAKASDNFAQAEQEIKDISDILTIFAPLIPNRDVKMAAQADSVLEAGRLSTKIAEDLSSALNELNKNEVNPQVLFNDFVSSCQALNGDTAKLAKVVRQINPKNLPDEYQDKFSILKEKIDVIENSASELANLSEALKLFLGVDYDQRYLFVFQNNSEMRGSGGFIGSYALADFSQGSLKNLEVPKGGSYDTEWGMTKKIIAPEALSIVNPRWYFWDSNWWPDWPTSARKIMWFYEASEGRTVNGVISVTPTVIEKVLGAIGPIDMQAKYGLTFTAENFWDLTQELSEQKPYNASSSVATSSTAVKHEPKKIIGDLIEEIKKELPRRLNREKFFSLLKIVEESIEQKQVQLYFTDEKLEQQAIAYGADSSIKNTKWDYLMVANTNIAGGKSDRKIKEEISHQAEIQSDGSVIDTLTIKRTHTALKNETFSGVRNNDWLRIYVPLGSELISADGFSRPDEIYFSKPEAGWQTDPDVVATEGKVVVNTQSGTKIYEENNKTVFANWSQLDPGSQTTIYLKYKLPFKIEVSEGRVGLFDYFIDYLNPNQQNLLPYALLVQKQPGSLGSDFSSLLTIDSPYKLIWSYNHTDNAKPNGWNFKDDLSIDRYYAALLTKD
jgi:hypothetical protein